MRKIVSILFLTLIAQFSFAQITETGDKVGLKRTNPKGILHVYDIGEDAWVYFENNLNGNNNPKTSQGLALGWNYSASHGESIINYNTSQGSSPRLDFTSFNGTYFKTEMTLKNGNVGIGTTVPGSKLVVTYDNGVSGPANTAITADAPGNTANDYSLYLRAKTGSGTVNNLMVVRGDGNVGIGTNAPSCKLQVKGGDTRFDSDYKVFIPSVGTSYFWKGTQDGLDNVRLSVWYKLGIYNPTTGGINTNNSDWNIRFCARNGKIESKGSAYFAITSGVVGIGTTSTGTHRLAVDGTIGAREIIVETGAWSDFVFNKDYELKDLESVESFIEENNHLPDIPSEKEILENGIEVGKMNAKLLQKIEELTLYMIEQNKETKAMKEQLNRLSEENEELKEKITKLETAE